MMAGENNRDKVFIVIPYFNEGEVIGEVVNGLRDFPHVVIVDDGSKHPLSLPGFKNIHTLRHRVNLGQGASLQTGIEFAIKKGADYVVTFDADGQHDPADIPVLLQPLLDKQCVVALGSRFLGKMSGEPAGRKRLLTFSRFVNRLFTGLSLTDAHNGLRAFSREAARQVKLKENRMAHATEILSIIKNRKLSYREVPVNIRYTEYSRKKGQKPANGIRIFFDLVLHKLFE